ncbi:VCBS domain-containing protein [Vibrio diazotrophicus]|uniref:VCBS domain-containing protein n=1 Tax=Vibrio diazotrophicus TaxID=685 RepID=UPI000C9E4640|nr:VCBS domain-containing protein [Vibrio diazotrophicus]PNH95404.1 hypothetical protein C1O24_14970 [Vibrio diazotrophicus]
MQKDNNVNSAKLNSLQLLQLEQRLMFDGAAVETTLNTFSDFTPNQVVVDAIDTGVFTLAVAYEEATPVAEIAQNQVKEYLSNATTEELFSIFNGGKESPDAQWLQAIEAVRQSILNDQFNIQIQLLDNETMSGHLGAYTSAGIDGEPTIYLNQSYLDNFGADVAAKVLVEELGHAIDATVNTQDSLGDEGQLFAVAVTETSSDAVIASALADDDSGTIYFEQGDVQVEWATFDFTNAYSMVYDLDNSGSVVGSDGETAAEKEQSLHNFNPNSLGAVTIDNGQYDSSYFSGNDVSAIGINIGGDTYYGWISRPIKSGGVVRGFYFWTDTDFVDLATAQADGNTDADRNTSDNLGFVLVVDQAWFDSQITSTRTTLTTNIDGDSTSHTYASVGSSSDRVDSALNALVDDLPTNNLPTATADANSSALELGTDNNGGSTTILTNTVNATGNVLSNDTDSDGDSLLVSDIASSVAGGTTSVVTSGTSIDGTYGTLTIAADGSYTYVIDNSDSTVNALLSGSVDDVFTYTVSDGNGGSRSTTLTITINGSNDAPLANDDYNTAKEELSSTAATEGYTATGNVLTNDTDVDSGDGKTITGLAASGSVDSTSVTVTAGASEFTFTGDSGFTSVSDSGNTYLYVSIGGIYRAVFDTNGNQVAVSSKVNPSGSDWTIGFSGKIASYYDASGNVTISDSSTFFTTNTSVGFEKSGTATTEDTSGMKTATVGSSTTTGYTTISGLSNISGTIAVGMSVSGTGVAAGTTVTELFYTSGVVSSIKLSQEFTSTAGTAFTFSGNGTLSQSFQGAHGALVLNSDGSYTYTPTTDNTLLSVGESADEAFDYTMQDTAGVTSTATLYITVYGSGANDPILAADTASAQESGVSVTGTNPTGNLFTAADTNAGFVTNVQYGANSETVGSGATDITIDGTFGTLTISGDGSYSYAVDNSNATVDALNSTQSLTETFTYTVGNSLDSGLSASSLTITINGANDEIVATDDTLAVAANDSARGGNVVSNDTDVDNADTKTVIEATAGSHDDPNQVNLPGYTSVTSSGVVISGQYGDLTIAADGTYSYAVDTNNATVIALTMGNSLTETFTYRVEDSASDIDDALITVTIDGVNDAPVNTFNGSSTFGSNVEAQLNTSFAFNSANNAQLQVGDADGDLSRVILNVDNGILAVTAGSVTVDGNGSETVTISGSQDDINAVLATLVYTPDTGFLGTDFLTILSQDGQNAYDSDGIAINIPQEFTGPTVSESALSSGSNATSTAETGASTLSAPSGQTFVASQSGTGTYGTWSLNESSGEFTYTLTTAADHSGGVVADTITIQTYDAYGNTVNNIVTVTINDDTPSAMADTNSVNEGSQAIGNVLTDGTGDVFGADGAQSTTPTGGIVGVRAAGADTTTAVSSGAGSSITGLYGSLVLNADGSYTYTANSNSVTSAQDDVFVYTIADSDGDLSTTTLTITVSDSSSPTIDVTGYGPVNENSDYAMFKIEASAGQTLDLSVANRDTALISPTIEFSTDGVHWSVYSSSNKPVGGTVYVRVDISSEVDTAYEGAEAFSLVATNSSNSSITDSADSSIIDDGTGTTFDGSLTSGEPDSSTTDLDDDRALSVSDVTVNEGSPYAVFTVSGAAGQQATLGLTNGTTSGLTGLQVFNGSNWVSYTSGAVVTLDANGEMLVRVALSPEQEAALDSGETFTITATNTGGSDATGTGTVMDDGAGDYFAADSTSGTSNMPSGERLNDDRALSVSDVTVNEGSPYVVFTVSGAAGQQATLGLTNGTTSGLTGLQVFNGSNWVSYTSGTVVTLGANGEMLVRVALSPEQEAALDTGETFTVSATNTGGTIASGIGTINDDGTGLYFAEENTSGVSNIPAGVVLDNDTPTPPAVVLDNDTPTLSATIIPSLPASDAPAGADQPDDAASAFSDQGGDDLITNNLAGELQVLRNIPEQSFSAGDGFTSISVQIPADTFGHTEPDARIQLSAVLVNGEQIPDWLVFDEQKGEFRGIPPKGFEGTLLIRIVARDSKGAQVETILTIEISNHQSKVSSFGKQELYAQLHSDTQFSWKNARDQLIQAARQLRG